MRAKKKEKSTLGISKIALKARLKRAETNSVPDNEIDFSENPEATEEFWKNAKIVFPAPKKKEISIRLDEAILKFFRKKGSGYQSRINAVLRAYVASQERE